MGRTVRHPGSAEAEGSGRSPQRLQGTGQNEIQATIGQTTAERYRRTNGARVSTGTAAL